MIGIVKFEGNEIKIYVLNKHKTLAITKNVYIFAT